MKHQVFLSFRGEDTRHNFTAHLLKALKHTGINVFFDEDTLEKGEKLSSALTQAIGGSNLSIIVLSKDYASSKSCLHELSHIMDRKKSQGQIVLPIFYHVDPSDVRNIGDSFKKSFDGHESKGPLDRVQKWKKSFAEVGQLKGWHIEGGKFDRLETEYIEDIVKYVTKKLMNNNSASASDEWVGIDDQKDMILGLMNKRNSRVIGLWGMGGIGKTTLADAVYNEVSLKFEDRCFIQNVSEKIEKQGRESLRNELLSKLLNEKGIRIDTPSIGSPYRERMNNKNVIVVLDDVTHPDQIHFMGLGHFGDGSKIIVTSRDKQLLKNGGANEIYEVKKLDEKYSLQLFCAFAFKQLNPAAGFQDLSSKFVKYTQGCPLALRVLASQLYTKSREGWESEVEKLEEYGQPEVSKILKRSFDGLDEVEKDIFLDIACSFKGEKMGEAEKIMSCFYKGAVCGIRNLVDRCLLHITQSQEISMHDLLEEMGKNIVRQKSKDPFKRSRLWDFKDVAGVVYDRKGTESIEGIMLEKSKMTVETTIDYSWLCPTAFQNMHNLRYINFVAYSMKFEDPVDIVSLPEELRYIKWINYPSKSLPSSFNPKNLVVLKIHNASLEQLWNEEDVQDLGTLREIRVSSCQKLMKIGNLLTAKKLEILDCEGCYRLVKLPRLSHLASLQELNLSFCSRIKKIPNLSGCIKLKILNVDCCGRLVELPCLSHLPSLEELNLGYCRSLKKFPEVPAHLSVLNLSYQEIEEMPYSIEHLLGLETLVMHRSKIKQVWSNISKLKSLQYLNLGCCPITELPEIPRSLTELDLSGSDIKRLSLSYKSDLRDLNIRSCPSFQKLQCNIVISGPKEIPTADVPSPILRLKTLIVIWCKSLRLLSELPPYLHFLDARGCKSLEEVSFADENLYQFDSLADVDHDQFLMLFSDCFSLNQDSVDNIEENAMLKIVSLAEKWAREDAHGHPKELICSFPGNKISASKFEHQSENSAISFKISPNECGGSRFLAFCIYVAYDFADCHCICEYKLTTSDGVGHEKFKKGWDLDYGSDKFKYRYLERKANHVFILFSEDMIKKDKNYEEASFQFYINGREVKKCGVHVLYVDEHKRPGIDRYGEEMQSESEEDANIEEVHQDSATELIRPGGYKRSFTLDAEEGEEEKDPLLEFIELLSFLSDY